MSVGDTHGRPSEPTLQVRVWVLLGAGAGDNAQLLRLAEALGWPFEAKRIRYNRLNRCPNLLLGASKLTVDTQASDPLVAPWPDLVIGASRRSAPVARWIKKQSGGHSRLVHLLHAQAPLHYFDLVVTTPQYRLPERSNVLHNLLPLNAAQWEIPESSLAQWRRRLEHLPRPWIAVLVGGDSSSYRLDAFTAGHLGQLASRTARESGGSLLISSSPRTPPDAADALLAALQGPAYVYRWQATNKDENAYPAYLALADRFIVTADSASMLAEACSTGRPVELFDWRPRKRPRRLLRAVPGSQWLHEALISWGVIKPNRDFQALHRELMERGLLRFPGQKESRQHAKPDDLARTVTRIRGLMGEAEMSGQIPVTFLSPSTGSDS
ncbi:MAG TPA: ELM1/GtrOC1 family putative glycosyltransferase [Candidatus Binatia bacterium]